MAAKAFFVAMAIVAAIVAPAMAKDIVVGDDSGWKLGFDYKAWAEGKQFYVGDTLVFNYKVGVHNVIKANQTEFQECAKPLTAVPLTSGNDTITLAAPGKKWYICGVANHCETGPMKLAINVLPQVGSPGGAPAPGPTGNPDSAAIGIAPSKFFSWMIVALAVSMMIMA